MKLLHHYIMHFDFYFNRNFSIQLTNDAYSVSLSFALRFVVGRCSLLKPNNYANSCTPCTFALNACAIYISKLFTISFAKTFIRHHLESMLVAKPNGNTEKDHGLTVRNRNRGRRRKKKYTHDQRAIFFFRVQTTTIFMRFSIECRKFEKL